MCFVVWHRVSQIETKSSTHDKSGTNLDLKYAAILLPLVNLKPLFQ